MGNVERVLFLSDLSPPPNPLSLGAVSLTQIVTWLVGGPAPVIYVEGLPCSSFFIDSREMFK